MFFRITAVLFVAPGGVELRLRRSQEVRGSLELKNGSLRALEEALMMISRLRHFPVKFGRWAQAVLAEEGLASSRAVPGAAGKASAPELWLESTKGCKESFG